MNTTIRQCLAFRNSLSATATKCEVCGYEIQSDTAKRTVITLTEKFEVIEAEFIESGLSDRKLEDDLEGRKGRIIRDFPVPNDPEDLLCLLNYIVPRLDCGNADPNIEEWRAKFKEVTTLAKNSFKNNVNVCEEVVKIERSAQIIMAGEPKSRARRLIVIIGVGLIILIKVLPIVSRNINENKAAEVKRAAEK